MNKQVIVTSGPVVLSDKAAAFLATPAPIMGYVEDVYSIHAGSTGWFVVYTNPQNEEKVAETLTKMRVDTFLPRIVEWKPRTRAERDQRKPLEPISKPLLSRYLFVRIPAAQRVFALIQGVDGVREILGNGEVKIAVPTPLVEFLREREDAGDFNRTEKRGRVVSPKWAKEGVSVRINDGPFSGFIATIQKCLPRYQVEVALSIFGRATIVRMELAQVVENAA